MATAKKMPSGRWNIQAYKTVDGVMKKKTITADSKAEAEYLAQLWQGSVVEEAKPEIAAMVKDLRGRANDD